MIACVDVHYAPTSEGPAGASSASSGAAARAAALAFDAWTAPCPREIAVVLLDPVEPYTPGAFYRRELPAVRAALAALTFAPDVVIVDGHAWLGCEDSREGRAPNRPRGRAGLGARLLEAEPRLVAVVGVAKTRFAGAPATPVLRGASKTPLWVDEAGVFVDAARRVTEMHGPFRIPTLLARVDRIARGIER